jgi:hypothetical protein
MERDSYFEFVGFAAVFVIAVTLIFWIQSALDDRQVLDSIRALSPWLAEHARPASWIASAVVFITALAIPPIFISLELSDGNSRLTTIGFVVWLVSLVPSIGYLLGVGWLGVQVASGG